ncbi:MAG: glutamate synthase, partial [Pyrobaculum sp.]
MCGIFGIYSRREVEASLVIRGLQVMRERGTPHGAGIALYRPSEALRIKAFSRRPVGKKVVSLPNGVFDVELNGHIDVDGFIYLSSRWIDVYKTVGWPEDLDKTYGVGKLKSRVLIGHSRYPTNSPGGMPYYSHPFAVGDVAIVHNGDLSSYGSNVNFIRHKVETKFTGNDSEAIAYLLAILYKEVGVEGAIRELINGRRYRWARLDGPYAVIFMIGGPNPVFGAFVDPQHFRPLYIGMTEDAVLAASEAAAIRAVAREAKIWALRGGEYVVVEREEVYGNFKQRYVYPITPPPPTESIDAGLYDVISLAGMIRRELRVRGEVHVVNVLGHRYLGNGMEGGVLKTWGVVGNASANVMSGGVFYSYGDVQDDFGDAMNGGVAVIYGNAGAAVGQAKRGGEIYIYGDAGTRAAIQHRGGVVVVGGSVGDYLGE